jgi:hypothetical protein
MDTQTLQRIQSLNRNANAIGGYFAKHAEVIAHPKVDKHGAGFEGATDRFQAFRVTASFCCHTGTYGSSSCSTDLSVRSDDVGPYFVKAMARHQRLLFDTAAQIMREEAAALTEKARAEIAALTQMVDALSSPTAEVEAA